MPQDAYHWDGVRIASLITTTRAPRSAAERRVFNGGALLDRLPIEAFVLQGRVSAPHAIAELGRQYELILVPEDSPDALRFEIRRLAAVPVLARLPSTTLAPAHAQP
jgi:hypothetical protein